MSKKILFLKIGTLSNINRNVLAQLKLHFPDNEILEIDVLELVLSKKKYKIANYFHFILEYGLDFLLLRKNRWAFWDWFRVTSYMFKKYKLEVQKYAQNSDILFTFQTGSTFDGSIINIPHFVYTDSTVLANYFYPGISIRSVLKSKAWMKLEPDVYKNAARNFVFSSNQQKSLIEQYNIPANKAVCVYAGMNKATSKITEEKSYLTKKILFAGYNWERKGGPLLLKAFRKVLDVHPDAELIIVGCKPIVDVKNCKILNRVSLTELEHYYHEATVFCMPTRIEPFGIVFIDAMNFKCPVVASNIGAIPDFVINNHNGYTLAPDDINGFADALIKLLHNPELCKEFGENGYKIAHQNYTWENTGKLIKQNIKASLKEN